jgi:hypothetical protein
MNGLQKLNTKEDKFFLHKILGIYCTLHYIWRYIKFSSTGKMGFDNLGIPSALSVVPHFLLPITSFFFHVLSKRIQSKPTIIWEEMRLHSIIFSTRSIAIFYWCYFNLPGGDSIFCRLAIVLFFHVLSDLASKKYGEPGKTTIRVLETATSSDPLISTIVKRFYAFAQIAATASLILPGPHTLDVSFSILIGIHYAAFLMTLNRKNIISKITYNIGYAISLLLVTIIVYCQLGASFYFWTTLLFAARVYGINKYIIWFIWGIIGNLRFPHPPLLT